MLEIYERVSSCSCTTETSWQQQLSSSSSSTSASGPGLQHHQHLLNNAAASKSATNDTEQELMHAKSDTAHQRSLLLGKCELDGCVEGTDRAEVAKWRGGRRGDTTRQQPTYKQQTAAPDQTLGNSGSAAGATHSPQTANTSNVISSCGSASTTRSDVDTNHTSHISRCTTLITQPLHTSHDTHHATHDTLSCEDDRKSHDLEWREERGYNAIETNRQTKPPLQIKRLVTADQRQGQLILPQSSQHE